MQLPYKRSLQGYYQLRHSLARNFRQALARTMDMLLNAGALHDEITRLARESAFAVVASSANISLTGSKFRFAAIEAPVREIAGLAIDTGL